MGTPRHPLWQLFLMRLRALWREPSALFWIFIFPILISIALGLAFRNQSMARLTVAVVEGPTQGPLVATTLSKTPGLQTVMLPEPEARRALASGKVALVVLAGAPPRLVVDPLVPEGRTARLLVLDSLQRQAGRTDALRIPEEHVSVPGRRYIDFLIPGLLGFGLMSSSVWGLGWGLVNMRTGKLLKRLVATPMRKADLLASFILSRLLLAVFETGFFLAFARLLFNVRVAGSLLSFVLVAAAGALSFGGVGLLVASRAQNTETAGGLMNLVTLPMTVLSGVFFSASHFPGWMQPLVKALPLTAVIDALRAISIDAAPLWTQGGALLVLAVWGALAFALALRIFRWS
ncbi:MAG: ABC transporter permease [Myxococcaceae bacterium]